MVGDPLYGIGNIIPRKMMGDALRDTIIQFKRQALHAVKLGLIHPKTNAAMEWQIELAEDMKALLEVMRQQEVSEEMKPFDFGVDADGLYVGDDDAEILDDDFDEEDY